MHKATHLLTGLIVAAAASLAASPAGLAQSQNAFSVSRTDRSLAGTPHVPFLVEKGDRLQAGNAPVLIEGTKGETILLGGRSEAEFTRDNAMRLLGGECAVSLPDGEMYQVEVADIRLSPISAEGDTDTVSHRAVAVAQTSQEEILLVSDGGMIRVDSLPDGNQIAVLGAGDSLRLWRDGLGRWVPSGPIAQFEGDPTEEDEERRRGIIPWFRSGGSTTAVVAGGAAAAGLIILGITATDIFDSDDDDDDDDDPPRRRRTPFSPVEPVDDDRPPFNEEWLF